MNVFEYSAKCEKMFENYLKDNGYERKTTFYNDLSIADFCEIYLNEKNSIKQTYKNVMATWLDDIVYITEFAMALNIKSWEFYERAQTSNNHKLNEIGQLYSDLYYKCRDTIYDYYSNDNKALEYYFNTTD